MRIYDTVRLALCVLLPLAMVRLLLYPAPLPAPNSNAAFPIAQPLRPVGPFADRNVMLAVMAWERDMMGPITINATKDERKDAMARLIVAVAAQDGFHRVAKALVVSVITPRNTTTGKPPLRPTLRSKVVVTYRNRQVGKPFGVWNPNGHFNLNGVIQGWTMVLQAMCEGDRWEVYIPWQMAYGASGRGKSIPPHTALVFQMRLERVDTNGVGCA